MTQVLIHTTKGGERWDELAHLYLGNPHRYGELIALNPHAPIHSTLTSGIRLNIPQLSQAELLDNALLPPWKRRAS